MLHMMLEDHPAVAESEFRFTDPGYSFAGNEQNFAINAAFVGGVPASSDERSNFQSFNQHSTATGFLPSERNSSKILHDEHSGCKTRFHPYQLQRSPIYTSAGQIKSSPNLDLGCHVETFNVNTDPFAMHFQDPFGNRNCNSNNNNVFVENYLPNDQIEKTSHHYTQAYSANPAPNHTFVTPTYCGVQSYPGNRTSSGVLPNNLTSQFQQNMASSPDSYNNDGGKDTKKKNTKKRKKKGSEPQRPVSAYALFFRDTQAAIKAENSSATFGEISKIVASMWDSLSEEDKQVYKQKTETAKRDYLKHLAAYRANMISKGTSLEAEEEDSQPLSVLREKIAEQQKVVPHNPIQGNAVIDLTTSENSLPPPPKLQLAPGISGINQMTEPHVRLQPLPNMTTSVHIPNTQQVTQQQRPISPGATLTKIIVPGQNGATIHFINKSGMTESHSNVTTFSGTPPASKPIVIRTAPTTSPSPSPIQLRNVISNPQSPITILPNKPGQIIKLVQSESGVRFATVDANNVKGRILKIDDIVQSASPIQTIPHAPTLVSPSQEQQTPILQLLADETESKKMEGTEDITDQVIDEDTLMQIPEQSLLPANDISSVMDELVPQPNGDQGVTALARKCVRDGCSNQAVSCPYWDNEYCSNECVYSHCRDVFDAWVSTRQVTSSAV